MPLNLPIALVTIDDFYHEQARKAMLLALEKVTPRQVLILTNDPAKIAISGAEYMHFVAHGSKHAASMAAWHELPDALKADHFIWIHWDSGILDESLWTDEYLEYDYIGAPWPTDIGTMWHQMGYRPGWNVGNGGFALRSTRLMRFLSINRDEFPIQFPEDDALCRYYRARLERRGFRWAPEELARRFSFECAPPPSGGTFGFHGVHNMEVVYPKPPTPGITYDPSIYEVSSFADAQAIITQADGQHTAQERWDIETSYLLDLIGEHLSAGAKVLDYGCGAGRLAKPLIARGASVIGVDSSQAMRKHAVEYVASQKFLGCDPDALAQLLNFGARVDLAVAVWVLQHVREPEAAIAQLEAALDSCGRLFVLNTRTRWVPLRVDGEFRWGDDGADIRKMLDARFGDPIAHGVPDPSYVLGDVWWAVYEVSPSNDWSTH